MRSLPAQIALRLAGLPVFIALILLWPAGTLDFWQVYLYFGVLLVPMLFTLGYFLRHDPALLERRLKMREKESTQKVVVALLSLSIIACLLVAGFDRRFGWSAIPVWLVLAADLLVVFSYLFILAVFKENRFAARTVEVVQEQRVIDTGPYARVRHPMYTGMLLLYCVTPIALGSWWALLPLVLFPFGIAARIRNEEMVLLRDLQGYGDYTQRIRWRLVPFIW